MKATAQIFLSYTRLDEDKVENLYQNLSNAGFKPWMDKKDILPGERWRSSIREAIQHSDFFLVCLSANSIDKRGWVQWEIRQALEILQEMFDSDIYLIPVRLEDCEVPKSLRELQWVNLFEEDGWKRLVKAIQVGMERRVEVPADEEPSPDTEMATSEECLERVQREQVMTGDVIFQTFVQAPMPLSRHIRLREFQTLVTERTRRFVGRDFIFSAIDELLEDPTFPSGYIAISGEPGIGKTALLAQLVKLKGYVHHFNIASQNIRSARDFLANICAQLIVRYDLEHFTLPPEATQDSGFLSQLLAEAAAKREAQKVVILVDALDEAEDIGLAPGANVLYLPPALPDGVYFVVTTRETADFRLFVDHRKDIYMRDDDPQNFEDVCQYIRNFVEEYQAQMVSRIGQWGVEQDEFVEVITEKSEGNFMYLVYVLSDIRDGKLTVENVDNVRDLPKGLQAYYQRHWRQMREGNEHEFDAVYEPIVCILAVAQEPVTIEQVAAWTKLSRGQVKRAIGLWCEFLEEELVDSERRYRIYHASFQDFLREQVE